jgi:hypothetical protein
VRERKKKGVIKKCPFSTGSWLEPVLKDAFWELYRHHL